MRVFGLALLIAAGVIACSSDSSKQADSTQSSAQPTVKTAAVTSQGGTDVACQAPSQVSSTTEETAWRLFVAAVCPVNSDKYPYVVWENWIEQNQLYNPTAGILPLGQRPRFHGSPLRAMLRRQAAGRGRGSIESISALDPAQDCATGSFGRVICEEARINPDAQHFIQDNNLTTKAGQVAFAAAGKVFEFPAPSVEVKADWVKLASCNAPPADVHVEKVNGDCYALAGFHLISKLIDKWIWATFEPQDQTTNPRRCQELGCNDQWGSNPSTTKGTPTQLTPALASLMTAANVAPEWKNYRLDGVQTDFMEGQQPTVLGNSIIEGELAGDPLKMKISSCITCHQFSTLGPSGRSGMQPKFVIGNPLPLPAGMISRDFVWSFFLAR